jgi:hypothetical protein
MKRHGNRNNNAPTNRNNNNGFRPASTLPSRNPQGDTGGACQGAKSRWSSRVGRVARPNEVQARQVW